MLLTVNSTPDNVPYWIFLAMCIAVVLWVIFSDEYNNNKP